MDRTSNDIRIDVARLRLDGWERVVNLPIEELVQCFNGAGPDFFPEKLRRKLDDLLNPLLPAVMVHDVDFTYSDGTLTSFKASNRRLLINSITCATHAYKCWDWRRWAMYIDAVIIYRACEQFGWIAWLSAFHKNKTQKGKHE